MRIWKRREKEEESPLRITLLYDLLENKPFVRLFPVESSSPQREHGMIWYGYVCRTRIAIIRKEMKGVGKKQGICPGAGVKIDR